MFLVSITTLLKNFKFVACQKEAVNYLLAENRFSFNNLNIKVDSHYLDASTYKVFYQTIFEVDVIGISDDPNVPYTSTLFLTDNFHARISITGNRTFCKFILDATNKTNQCFYMTIFDATSLEEYCYALLRGHSSRNFVTTIDIFKLKE